MNEYIITCDEETASWIGNDVDSMRPLVRCKDCERFHTNTNGFDCSNLDPGGFCAWGVQKEGCE